VDKQVHHGEQRAVWFNSYPSYPTVQKRNSMVVPVKEDNRLFLQNQQERVNELRDFAQAEQTHPTVFKLNVAPAQDAAWGQKTVLLRAGDEGTHT